MPLIEEAILRFIEKKIQRLAVDEALRFLFRLDTGLYILQGQKAVELGKGTHVKHRFMKYHDFFVDRIRPEEKVLDVGCGIGAVAHDVAKRSRAYVTGIDISPDNIALACAKHHHPNVTYVVADANSRLPDGSFDAVILSNILEHLSDRPAFLRQLQETAAAKRYLLRVPLFERDWRVPVKKELGTEWRLDTTHEVEYTLESFQGEMKEAGLVISHVEIRWGEIWAEAVASPKQE